MQERFFPGVISGQRKGVLAVLGRPLLRFLSLFYGIAIHLRSLAYAVGLKRRRSLDVPVISVGNITTGGTGKTPMVAYLANMLKNEGHTPVILSRGYKATDGKNDEAEMLSNAAPGIVHLQGADRVANGRKAIGEHSATCLLLDDGFQHWRIHRDLDIVLIDALNPLGYARLLPRGLLREPFSALKRADAVLLTRADQVKPDKLKVTLGFIAGQVPGIPIATSRHRVTGLVRLGKGKSKEPGIIRGKKVLAFCGIGNPRSFMTTLLALGAELKMFIPLRDHQRYPPYLLKKIDVAVEKLGVEVICTTAKDAVKLAGWDWPKPCYSVNVELDFIKGEKALKELVLKTVGGSMSPEAEQKAE